MSRYYIEAPFTDGNVTIKFVSLEDEVSPESAPASKVAVTSSNAPANIVYYCDVPYNVSAKPDGYQWAVTVEDTDNDTTLRTDIYTVNRPIGDSVELIRQEVMEQRLINDVLKSLIDGRTTVEGDTVLVWNKDDIVIQKLTVDGNARTPEFTDILIDWVDGEPVLRTVEVTVGEGVTRRELAQAQDYGEGGAE